MCSRKKGLRKSRHRQDHEEIEAQSVSHAEHLVIYVVDDHRVGGAGRRVCWQLGELSPRSRRPPPLNCI